MSPLASLLVVASIFSSTVFARIEDFITISVDDKTFKISKDEMKKILATADLESLGYRQEELTTTSKDSKGNSVNSTIIQYLKKVPCSDASKTFKELKDRISDRRISALLDRTALDLSKQDTAGKMCQIGIKVDSKTFKPGSKMADSPREKRFFWRRRRRRRRSSYTSSVTVTKTTTTTTTTTTTVTVTKSTSSG
ncbi:PREDICTED: uncharacterized protein LOC107327997 isoform X2 [Acropora digitifera]|uniref:uncharacterized protein LOC107327997 isoform X2 n=1 Tax=Acropora digitifera TaxID=70779 RepID=UPI00077A0A75|nr:PREDICTED: uncharacterized protein LOC107327997 isoform X2 [Acropora digitifera]